MTLTRDIAMSRDIDNATCHTHGPDMWHFLFFFSKLKKNKKKHRLTGDTLTNGIEALFQKL